jgi:teichoic acid transport system permease protein
LFDIFREHKKRGKQIFILAKTDLVKKYKGSVVGPLWAVVKPIFTLFIYWFAFAIGLRGAGGVSYNGVEYARFVFMLTGFVPWFFMSDSILGGARSIRKNKQFVVKMSFPVSTIMTFVTISQMYVHFALVVLMYITLFFTQPGFAPSVYNLQFFYYCPLMFLFFLFLTWSTAPMAAFSKDFENFLNSIMQGIFWLSGIVWNTYDTSGIPKIIGELMYYNPVNYFANGYRKAFIYNEWFFENPKETIIFFVELVIIFLLGIYNYKRLRKRLPDVL